MNKFALPVLAIALALPMAAQAKNNYGQDNRSAAPAHHSACPPGLAKKTPACVPPGQARKAERDHRDDGHIHLGSRLSGDYILIRTPERYGLDPYGTYYRQDGYIYRVDHQTMEVLGLIGAVNAIPN